MKSNHSKLGVSKVSKPLERETPPVYPAQALSSGRGSPTHPERPLLSSRRTPGRRTSGRTRGRTTGRTSSITSRKKQKQKIKGEAEAEDKGSSRSST